MTDTLTKVVSMRRSNVLNLPFQFSLQYSERDDNLKRRTCIHENIIIFQYSCLFRSAGPTLYVDLLKNMVLRQVC